ncbi:hypothetical protein NPN23_23390, partial [Vibrio parahaemolyticus]|nr:hypothetical protein [Vibrio parahaemolyticus]
MVGFVGCVGFVVWWLGCGLGVVGWLVLLGVFWWVVCGWWCCLCWWWFGMCGFGCGFLGAGWAARVAGVWSAACEMALPGLAALC